MSNVKISENQFLGKQELKRVDKFIKEDGYNNLFKSIVGKYGVVKLGSDPNFNALRIIQGADPLQLVLKAGLGIDKDINQIRVRIDQEELTELICPNDNVSRNVIIKHKFSHEEDGEINIAVDGSLTGIDTKFLETLRGTPHHPVVIKFLNSSSNLQEYTVSLVNSNTSARIQGPSFTAETKLKYKVVGTFIPGVSIPSPNKDIYDIDSYEVRIEAVTYVPIVDVEFILAKVTSDGTTTIIEDRRSDCTFEIVGANPLVYGITQSSFMCGLETLKFDTIYSSHEHSLSRIGWGLRTTDWTADIANDRLTIASGAGGVYPNISTIAANAFQNWRVYFSNGKYQKVVSSTSPSGTVVIQFENYDPAVYPTSGEIAIVPEADFIEIKSLSLSNTSPNCVSEQLFPIQAGYGEHRIKVGVFSVLLYRFILNGNATPFTIINTGSFLAPGSFDDAGVQVATVTGSSALGYFANLPHPSMNHRDYKAWRNQPNTFTSVNTFQENAIFSKAARVDGFLEMTPYIDTTVSGIGITYALTTKGHIRFETSTGAIISAITGGAAGRIVIFSNATISTGDIAFASAGTSTDSIFLPNGPILLKAGMTAAFIYDASVSRWLLLFCDRITYPWHYLEDVGEPTLVNGYTQGTGFERIAFRLEGDVVRLRGKLNASGVSATAIAFTLPVGYRPLAMTLTTILAKPSLTSPYSDVRPAFLNPSGHFTVQFDTSVDAFDIFNLAEFPTFTVK